MWTPCEPPSSEGSEVTSGRTIRRDASPNSRKNRWLRIQEICDDIDKLEVLIESRHYGPKGTLALMSFRDLLRRTIYYLEKGGL